MYMLIFLFRNLESSSPKASSFVEIVASEKEEKDNLFKMKAKPFMLTQVSILFEIYRLNLFFLAIFI